MKLYYTFIASGVFFAIFIANYNMEVCVKTEFISKKDTTESGLLDEQNSEPIIDIYGYFSDLPHTSYLSCSISQDGGVLAIGDHKTKVRIWDIREKKCRTVIERENIQFFNANHRLSDQGDMLVVLDTDGGKYENLTLSQQSVVSDHACLS